MNFELLIDNLDEIIKALGLDLQENSNRYFGRCPVHNGDRNNSFQIYKNSGIWRCYTRHCESEYNPGILGLVSAILDTNNTDVYKFLKEIVGPELFDNSQVENSGFIKYNITRSNKQDKSLLTREVLRNTLKFPAEYYLDRGFLETTLDRYDVGLCINSERQMYKRIVVPIYNISYSHIVACSGRATYKTDFKWIHSKSFNRDNSLYNSWFAGPEIKKSKTAILTEGPGKVWKLEEAGLKNSLAIYGTELTFNQQRILSNLGALNIVLALDNDPPGQSAMLNIYRKLKHLYNVHIPDNLPEDIDQCKIQEIQKIRII